jgi:hypothetical protein
MNSGTSRTPPRRHRWHVTVAGIAVVALAGAGIAHAGVPGSDGVIHGCYRTSGGQLRVVHSDRPDCGKGEQAIEWSKTGPQGFAGTDGNNGTDGRDGVDGIDGADGTDGIDGTWVASLDSMEGLPCRVATPQEGLQHVAFDVEGLASVYCTTPRTVTVHVSKAAPWSPSGSVTWLGKTCTDLYGPSTTCLPSFDYGTVVTFTKESWADWYICDGTKDGNTCTVTADTDKSVFAQYNE